MEVWIKRRSKESQDTLCFGSYTRNNMTIFTLCPCGVNYRFGLVVGYRTLRIKEIKWFEGGE